MKYNKDREFQEYLSVIDEVDKDVNDKIMEESNGFAWNSFVVIMFALSIYLIFFK